MDLARYMASSQQLNLSQKVEFNQILPLWPYRQVKSVRILYFDEFLVRTSIDFVTDNFMA